MLAILLAVALAVSAPEYEAHDLSGASVTSSELDGQIAVYNFWMMGCGPCVAELDALNPLPEKHPDVRFLAVTGDARADVKRFLERKPFTWRQLPGAARLAGAFGVSGYPTHAVVDRSGRLVAWFMGGERIAEKLEAVLAWVKAGEKPADKPDVGYPPPERRSERKVRASEGWPPEVDALVAKLKSENKSRIAHELVTQLRAAERALGWFPTGRIVVGQVAVEGGEDPRKVLGPVPILDEGYFAAAVDDSNGRLVLTGYEPAHLLLDDDADGATWLGTVTLTRLAPQQLARLEGRVRLPARELTRVTATLRPQVDMRGHQPGQSERPFDPAIAVKVAGDGSFRVRGLSPTRYCLEVEAPGRLRWQGCTDLRTGVATRMVPIELEPQRTLNVTAIERSRSGFRLEEAERFTLKGATAWDNETEGPPMMRPVLLQRAGTLSFYSHCEAQSLGLGPVEQQLDAQWVEGEVQREQLVREGTRLLLRCPGDHLFLLAFSTAGRAP